MMDDEYEDIAPIAGGFESFLGGLVLSDSDSDNESDNDNESESDNENDENKHKKRRSSVSSESSSSSSSSEESSGESVSSKEINDIEPKDEEDSEPIIVFDEEGVKGGALKKSDLKRKKKSHKKSKRSKKDLHNSHKEAHKEAHKGAHKEQQNQQSHQEEETQTDHISKEVVDKIVEEPQSDDEPFVEEDVTIENEDYVRDIEVDKVGQGDSMQNAPSIHQGTPVNQGAPINQGIPINQGAPINQGSPIDQEIKELEARINTTINEYAKEHQAEQNSLQDTSTQDLNYLKKHKDFQGGDYAADDTTLQATYAANVGPNYVSPDVEDAIINTVEQEAEPLVVNAEMEANGINTSFDVPSVDHVESLATLQIDPEPLPIDNELPAGSDAPDSGYDEAPYIEIPDMDILDAPMFGGKEPIVIPPVCSDSQPIQELVIEPTSKMNQKDFERPDNIEGGIEEVSNIDELKVVESDPQPNNTTIFGGALMSYMGGFEY